MSEIPNEAQEDEDARLTRLYWVQLQGREGDVYDNADEESKDPAGFYVLAFDLASAEAKMRDFVARHAPNDDPDMRITGISLVAEGCWPPQVGCTLLDGRS